MIQNGLSGVRSISAVNHLVSMYESTKPGERALFEIARDFLVEKLSEKIGLEAIRVMYSSKWGKNNPVVKGYVFEGDILTRLSKDGKISTFLQDGSNVSWTVSKTVRLAEFLLCGMTDIDSILVCPEKWNNLEYDGLFIHRDEKMKNHLVAWNASSAVTHGGKVSKLVAMLETLAQQYVIQFESVRFIFLAPMEALDRFHLPSTADALLARHQLKAWSFSGFEVGGIHRAIDCGTVCTTMDVLSLKSTVLPVPNYSRSLQRGLDKITPTRMFNSQVTSLTINNAKLLGAGCMKRNSRNNQPTLLNFTKEPRSFKYLPNRRILFSQKHPGRIKLL